MGTIVLACLVALVPREKGPLELAALSAAVLVAVELSLTHWFYLYLPWVLPFALLAFFLPREREARAVPLAEHVGADGGAGGDRGAQVASCN